MQNNIFLYKVTVKLMLTTVENIQSISRYEVMKIVQQFAIKHLTKIVNIKSLTNITNQ